MSDKFSFLKHTHPFELLPDDTLTYLADALEEMEFNQTGIIYEQHKTKVDGLDIIVTGNYETYFYNSEGKKEAGSSLKPGDTYGAFSILLNKEKSIKTVSASKKTKIYRVPAATFKALCKEHDAFYQSFVTLFGKEMLNDAFANFVTRPTYDLDTLTFDRYFIGRMDSVNTRPIVSCERGTPAHEAAKLMEANKLSCLFITEGDTYIGYVTDILLRNKIIAARRDADTPVEAIMEGPIYRISREAYIYEAILMMFNHKIRYLIVEDHGQETGVISRSKLLSDQAQSPFVFIQSVRLAMSVDELKAKWAEVPEVVYNLLTRGVKSELANQIITNISDTIAQKVIEGVIDEIGPPPAKFVFMALGSEGRMEQTLKTDQDNAIIYEDKANEFRGKTRTYFLHFAELVSERLNHIGFVFCTGGLMAKNPKWTHSLSHWKRNYNEWIENPDPQSVMNFSTFFDCRMIYGEESLVKELQAHILQKLEDPGTYFFTQLATNALQYEPPLTFFRGIKTIEKDDQQVFNIKRSMTPIVDLVRVYALKHKILKTNTGERLSALRDQKVFTEEDYLELMQSYYYMMGMRLRYQARQIMNDHSEPHNYVSPGNLTKIEVVTLKAIFKVIENFQQGIKINFTRNLFG
ncbi:DUF294 nucleotidyltransferase-like domain-containing protein [Marinoscillum sp.]|uniref:DUF294 nucleotidyltransferase-like domain-containing protein n=1 Tax=Marinoscillum sp. TaxID=2024838 RepID=UPI003BACDD84